MIFGFFDNSVTTALTLTLHIHTSVSNDAEHDAFAPYHRIIDIEWRDKYTRETFFDAIKYNTTKLSSIHILEFTYSFSIANDNMSYNPYQNQYGPPGSYNPSPSYAGSGAFTPTPPYAGAGGFTPAPPYPSSGGYTPAPSFGGSGGYTPAPFGGAGGYTPPPPFGGAGGYTPPPPFGGAGGYTPPPPHHHHHHHGFH